MHPTHKRKSLIGLGLGLALLAPGLGLLFAEAGPRLLIGLLIVVGIPFYIWGCIELARAKGYSTAVVFTTVLGLLFPLVVLLALPDKRRHYRGRS